MRLRKRGKKNCIAFMKYFLKIIRQLKENAVHFLLDQNRFYWYALIIPISQSKHNQFKLLHTLIKTHPLTNERVRTILIIFIITSPNHRAKFYMNALSESEMLPAKTLRIKPPCFNMLVTFSSKNVIRGHKLKLTYSYACWIMYIR